MTSTPARTPFIRRLALSILVGAVVTACGGTTTTSGPGSTRAGAASGVPGGPAATPGGVASAAAGKDACDLLDDAQVQTVAGFQLLSKKPGPTMGIWENGCVWDLESGVTGASWQVVLGVLTPGGRHYYDTFMAIMEGEQLTGLGDAAIRSEANTVVAVKGDAVVSIQYIDLSAPREEVPVELIKLAFAHLGV